MLRTAKPSVLNNMFKNRLSSSFSLYSAVQDMLQGSGWDGASLDQGMRFLLLGNPCTRFLHDQGCRGPEAAWQCLSARGRGTEGMRSISVLPMSPVCAGLISHPSWFPAGTFCVLQGLTASHAYGNSLTAAPFLWRVTTPKASSHP